MPFYFDTALTLIAADKLKTMARIWGGTTAMRKDECIDCIIRGLANPAQVKAVVDGLEPWQRNALALIKRMGGVIESYTLYLGILMSGIQPLPKYDYRDSVVDSLFRKGLIQSTNPSNPGGLSYSYEDYLLYTDERLLAVVDFPEIQQFDLSAIGAPADILARQPSTVTLDIMGILQTIEKMGGLGLTQSGEVRANDEKKVRKAMGWDEKGIEIDGFYFPDPINAWVGAFRYSDLLLLQDDNHLIVKESLDNFALHPFSEQVRFLMEGLIRSDSWQEMPSDDTYYDRFGKGRRQGRLAINLALSALPIDSDAFFSIDEFDQAVFDRIGEHFTLGYPPSPPYFLNSQTSQEKKQKMADWRINLRADWLKQERPWLESAFTTWLYFLGLVELTVKDERVFGFRLTNAGKLTFHPELQMLSRQMETKTLATDQPAWVVQPNFDIIAYLDRTSALQLAFLERHAERTQIHSHTAHYRLTRQSVYSGLESGTPLADLLDGLKAGAQNELPQNVMVELREWASLRDRIVLRRSACVLEFATGEALQSAAKSLSGRLVEERFLLYEQKSEDIAWPAGFEFVRINYARPLPKVLSVTENGKIHLKKGAHDLIIADQLTQWAVRISASEWQLTAESVSTQLKIGRKLSELLGLLGERSVHSFPPLLDIALRSWAGEIFQAELDSVVVLHCPLEQLFRAISNSQTIKPFLKGYLHPNLLIVDANQLDSLLVQLNWLGCFVSDQLSILPLNESGAQSR